MAKSLDERRSHLELNEPCIEIGGGSKDFRGLLAHYLKTRIFGRPNQLCHACHNGKCSNPKHLYWGTPQDNRFDYLDNVGKRAKKKDRAKAGSQEHKDKIRATLKVYYSDPDILQRQRERLFAAQKKRKCFAIMPK